MQITIQIRDRRISDLLHGHTGAYSSWMHSLKGKWTHAGGAKIVYDTAKGDEGNAKGFKIVHRYDVEKGMLAFQKDAPMTFAEFLAENDDNNTFDMAWQYIIFGRLVYS